MGNMSYCRFENTAGDLRECLDALHEGVELSEDEMRAKKRLIKICADILDLEGYVVEKEGE